MFKNPLTFLSYRPIIISRGDIMVKNLDKCISCGRELVIKEYECEKCGINVRGNFRQDKFSRLSQEERDFIEVFVMKRGNFKEVEKALNISYPTVRNRLDRVIESLGHKVESSHGRLEILQMLDNGEISSEEAAVLLENLNESGEFYE